MAMWVAGIPRKPVETQIWGIKTMYRIGLYDTFDIDREDIKALCEALEGRDVATLTKIEHKIYVLMRRKGLLTVEGYNIKSEVDWNWH